MPQLTSKFYKQRKGAVIDRIMHQRLVGKLINLLIKQLVWQVNLYTLTDTDNLEVAYVNLHSLKFPREENPIPKE